MKSKLIKIAFTSLLLAGSSQAQTVIDITGSTAGRGAVHAAILNLLTGETFAWDGTASAGSANRVIYHGTYSGNSYIIRTFWAGSVNGVRDVARQTQQSQFFATSVIGSAAPGTNINPATPLATASAETAPEIGFSDVFQTSTEFTSPALVVEDEVGIIPFKWFKNDPALLPNNLTNMTHLGARALYGALGEVLLSTLTGNPADSGTTVYVTGRNADSGSRITVMAEIQYGVFNSLNQSTFTSTASDGTGTITAANFVGNLGYSSGGDYSRAVLGSTWADGIIVSYLGASDWANAAGAGAVELSHNGVPYSVQNVQQGTYTNWGYLHQNRMAMTAGTPQITFYNGLRDEVRLNPGSLLVKDDATMKVERQGDGAPVLSK
jgi:hypothetical protein